MNADGPAQRAAASLGLETASGGDAAVTLKRMRDQFEADQRQTEADFVAEAGTSTSAQPIPLARLRRLVKCDGTVGCNLATEMLVLLGRATQLVVADLTSRSAWFAHERQRRVLHGTDVVSAVDSDARYDFLVDVVGTLPGADEAAPVVLSKAAMRGMPEPADAPDEAPAAGPAVASTAAPAEAPAAAQSAGPASVSQQQQQPASLLATVAAAEASDGMPAAYNSGFPASAPAPAPAIGTGQLLQPAGMGAAAGGLAPGLSELLQLPQLPGTAEPPAKRRPPPDA